MKYLRKIFRNEGFFVLFFSFLIIFLSFFPTIYEAFQAGKLGDSRRIMLWGEHNFTYDYNVYLAKMRQGVEGRWTVINKYTSEPHKGSFIQELYLLVGKIGGWFGLSPPLAYQFFRLLLAVNYIFAIYWLICYFLKDSNQRKIAFILALFSGSLPKLWHYQRSLRFALWFDWWQEVDQIKRATYVPHYVLGHLLTIVCLLLWLKAGEKKKSRSKWKYLLGASFGGIIAGFVHPPSLLIVWGILGFLTLIKSGQFLTQKYSLRYIIEYIVIFIFFVLFSSLPLIYINRITSIYPWKSIIDYDQANPWIYSLKEYFLSLGIILPLGLLGLFWSVVAKKKDYLALLFWVLTVPFGMLALKLTGSHSELYFIQVAVHLPLAIFSALIMTQFCQWLKSRRKVDLLLPLTIVILLISLPGIYGSIQGQIQFINERVRATWPLVPYPSQVMYPLKDWWEGILWLKDHTGRREVILAEQTAGNYIPAYAGNTVYIGHVSETVNFLQKKALVDSFFRNGLKVTEAKQFLNQNQISYVFFDPQAAELGGFNALLYPFLKPVWRRPYVIIYQVVL